VRVAYQTLIFFINASVCASVNAVVGCGDDALVSGGGGDSPGLACRSPISRSNASICASVSAVVAGAAALLETWAWASAGAAGSAEYDTGATAAEAMPTTKATIGEYANFGMDGGTAVSLSLAATCERAIRSIDRLQIADDHSFDLFEADVILAARQSCTVSEVA
jgi:hypothetical protein